MRKGPWTLSWTFVLLLISTLQLCAVKADPSVTISSTTSPISSVLSPTHTVKVGLADHKFEPDTTQAGVGDVSSGIDSCLHSLYFLCTIVRGT
jgi:hypothetical protein